jgi:hypothetical protein
MKEVGKAPMWTSMASIGWEGTTVDPTAVEAAQCRGGRGGGASAWCRPDSGGGGTPSRRVCGVDPTTVGDMPVWTRQRGSHRGAGRVDGGEMIPPGLGFKGQSCN